MLYTARPLTELRNNVAKTRMCLHRACSTQMAAQYLDSPPPVHACPSPSERPSAPSAVNHPIMFIVTCAWKLGSIATTVHSLPFQVSNVGYRPCRTSGPSNAIWLATGARDGSTIATLASVLADVACVSSTLSSFLPPSLLLRLVPELLPPELGDGTSTEAVANRGEP